MEAPGHVPSVPSPKSGTAALYSRLAGYPASLGPFALCLLRRLPPSSPALPLSILGLPGFAQNICVIVQDNYIPDILFKS